MKIFFRIVVGFVALVALSVTGVFGWATHRNGTLLSRTVSTHTAAFPVPFPLDEGEVDDVRRARARSGAEAPTREELGALALERALERGRHLVEARYACSECHGADFGGGVMIDDPMIGRILGPNITAGEGGRTADYTPADWDRIVRHGVLPDGRPAAMPSEDFQRMSDQELSDIVAYLESRPPVDATVPPVKLGPLGSVLMAIGKIPLSADLIHDHESPHARVPPVAEVSVEFGEHLAGVCTGCHGEDLAGGPIPAGPPDWAPAANLTPHTDGLGAWSYEQFTTAMRRGTRPDGSELRLPMTMVRPYAERMSDVEMEALWTYLRSVPPRPSGG